MIITAILIESNKDLSNDNRNQNSFMSVSVNSIVNKKGFHLQVSLSTRAGTRVTRPVLVSWLFGWKQVLSPAANLLAGWRSKCFSLQGRFEVDCAGIGAVCLKVYPLPTGEVWLFCHWLCVYLWDRALKPLHPQVERYCQLREWFHSGFWAEAFLVLW